MLTSANFLSKILGVIYVIPFYMLVGDAGGTLFNYGYIPYMIFISISTMGIPLRCRSLYQNTMRLAIIQQKKRCIEQVSPL